MELGTRSLRLQVIDSLLNLLFRCGHRRLTRPVAPITKAGEPHSQSYVVCLDCGKQFEYDMREMRIGKRIESGHAASVVPEPKSMQPAARMKYAVLAAVPVAIVVGAIFKAKSSGPTRSAPATDQPATHSETGRVVPRGE